LDFLKENLSKRDFTCNAMAINYYWNKYEQRENWQLIDPYNAHYSLTVAKRLQPIPTNPLYIELLKDPVRILRALRQCDRLGLSGFDEVVAIFKENKLSLHDAIFMIKDTKLKSEYDKLVNQFKERLPLVLEKNGMLNAFAMRGVMNYSPQLFAASIPFNSTESLCSRYSPSTTMQ
jgi:tRNA nucleotidyltransferase/poly(A) polymerase